MTSRAVNGLVFDLAQGLRDVAGVPVDTIRRILGRAEDLLTELAGVVAAPRPSCSASAQRP